MVTTVGTSSSYDELIKNFVQLERDAIAAYDTCIERLEDPANRERISAFRDDHRRHLTELEAIAGRLGTGVSHDTSMKSMLTTGKVQLADLAGGDGAILKAMSTNEDDTISAYDSGSGNAAVPPEDKPIFTRALEDERTHKAWMQSAAEAA